MRPGIVAAAIGFPLWTSANFAASAPIDRPVVSAPQQRQGRDQCRTDGQPTLGAQHGEDDRRAIATDLPKFAVTFLPAAGAAQERAVTLAERRHVEPCAPLIFTSHKDMANPSSRGIAS